LLSLAILCATILAGTAIRFAHLGLPAFVVKFGGSMLWAMMMYWVVSTVLPRTRFLAACALAGALCTAVEFAKLYHSPGLDAFRHTLAGILLLGRIFSTRDILAYWIAITIATILDLAMQRGLNPAPSNKPGISSL
jgi:hypothetical protein